MAKIPQPRSRRRPGSDKDLSPLGTFSPADGSLLNRRSTLEWKLDQGTAWRGGSLEPFTGLTPSPVTSADATPPTKRSGGLPLSEQPAVHSDGQSPNNSAAIVTTGKGDTAPLPKRETRLVWKNGMDVSNEFRDYAERVAAGENLPPFQGSFLADPSGSRISSQPNPVGSAAPEEHFLLDKKKALKRAGPCPNPAQLSTGSLWAILGLTSTAAAGVGFVLWTTASQAQHPLASADWIRQTATAVESPNRGLAPQAENRGYVAIAQRSVHSPPQPKVNFAAPMAPEATTSAALALRPAPPKKTRPQASVSKIAKKQIKPVVKSAQSAPLVKAAPTFTPQRKLRALAKAALAPVATASLAPIAGAAVAPAAAQTSRPLSLQDALRDAVPKSEPKHRRRKKTVHRPEIAADSGDSKDLLVMTPSF